MIRRNRKNGKRNKLTKVHKKSFKNYSELFFSKKYDKLLKIIDYVNVDSSDCQLLFLKSKVLYEKGELDKALSYAQSANSLMPENLNILAFVAILLEKNHDFFPALSIYLKIFKIDPDNVNALKNMAGVLQRLEQFEKAIVCYKKALNIEKNDPESTRNIGLCYYLLGKLDSAADYYEKAISLGEETSKTLVYIGNLFLSKGDREYAAQAFKKAIEEDDRCYLAYKYFIDAAHLSDLERSTIINTLDVFIGEDSLSINDKRLCHFSLGSLYHKEKHYDKAIHHYKKGNEHRANVLGKYDINSLVNHLKWSKNNINKDIYDHDTINNIAKFKEPVFVVGMPRSGTTLLEQIISSHNAGHGAGELSTIKNIITELVSEEDYNSNSVKHIKNLSKEEKKVYQKKYIKELKRHNFEAERIVDKMPGNLLHIWLIAFLFPDAPIIYCKRDPLDTCLSCFFANFNNGHQYNENLYTLGQYYTVYSKFIAHWKETVPNHILDVQYEDLVTDSQSVSKKIIDHVGLEWDPNCLALRNKSHFSTTASNLQIREGIYKTSVKRWKKYEPYLDELKQGLIDGETLI